MFTPRLNLAQMRLETLKGPVLPKLERAMIRHNRIENSDRFRKLIELRHSAPDEREVRDLNLFVSRLSPYEDLCPAAQKIARRLYGQAGGFFDMRAVGIEHRNASI